jgi:16S rRNA (guanine966-N2)-methyltransferase
VTRIIAGTVGGRRLEVPKGDLTRPTSDRVREAVFSGLEARGVLQGAQVMDLFAGSGALGLEAASRGAAEVVLVDSSRRAAEVARRNVTKLGMRATVVLSSVQKYLTGRTPVRQDVVLIDPPYGIGEDVVAEVLATLVDGGWLAPGGLVVLERSSRGPEPRWPSGLVREGVRRYGETAIWTAVAQVKGC